MTMTDTLVVVLVVLVMIATALKLAVIHKKRSGQESKEGPDDPLGGNGEQGWFTKYWWVILILIVLAGLGVWWWSTSSSAPPATPSASSAPGTGWSPTPSGVWEFTKNYWFWTIIGLAFLFFVFGGIAKPWAKAVQGMVSIVAVTLVGAMIVHGIWGESSSSPKISRSEIPLASSPQSEWPKLVIPSGGKSQFVPRPSGMKISMAGKNFEGFNVFESSECSFLKTCPEGSLGAYARNLSEKENIISYAYVPD